MWCRQYRMYIGKWHLKTLLLAVALVLIVVVYLRLQEVEEEGSRAYRQGLVVHAYGAKPYKSLPLTRKSVNEMRNKTSPTGKGRRKKHKKGSAESLSVGQLPRRKSKSSEEERRMTKRRRNPNASLERDRAEDDFQRIDPSRAATPEAPIVDQRDIDFLQKNEMLSSKPTGAETPQNYSKSGFSLSDYDPSGFATRMFDKVKGSINATKLFDTVKGTLNATSIFDKVKDTWRGTTSSETDQSVLNDNPQMANSFAATQRQDAAVQGGLSGVELTLPKQVPAEVLQQFGVQQKTEASEDKLTDKSVEKETGKPEERQPAKLYETQRSDERRQRGDTVDSNEKRVVKGTKEERGKQKSEEEEEEEEEDDDEERRPKSGKESKTKSSGSRSEKRNESRVSSVERKERGKAEKGPKSKGSDKGSTKDKPGNRQDSEKRDENRNKESAKKDSKKKQQDIKLIDDSLDLDVTGEEGKSAPSKNVTSKGSSNSSSSDNKEQQATQDSTLSANSSLKDTFAVNSNDSDSQSLNPSETESVSAALAPGSKNDSGYLQLSDTQRSSELGTGVAKMQIPATETHGIVTVIGTPINDSTTTADDDDYYDDEESDEKGEVADDIWNAISAAMKEESTKPESPTDVRPASNVVNPEPDETLQTYPTAFGTPVAAGVGGAPYNTVNDNYNIEGPRVPDRDYAPYNVDEPKGSPNADGPGFEKRLLANPRDRAYVRLLEEEIRAENDYYRNRNFIDAESSGNSQSYAAPLPGASFYGTSGEVIPSDSSNLDDELLHGRRDNTEISGIRHRETNLAQAVDGKNAMMTAPQEATEGGTSKTAFKPSEQGEATGPNTSGEMNAENNQESARDRMARYAKLSGPEAVEITPLSRSQRLQKVHVLAKK